MKQLNLNTFSASIASLYPTLSWHIDIPRELSILADENLLRQVFINLVKNAIEVGAKSIGIRHIPPAKTSERSANGFGTLQVSNDGHTISDEVARQIFIPFFTTKQSGSGIGLSLSRQILMRQKLTLSLRQHPITGYNVTFEIENDR